MSGNMFVAPLGFGGFGRRDVPADCLESEWPDVLSDSVNGADRSTVSPSGTTVCALETLPLDATTCIFGAGGGSLAERILCVIGFCRRTAWGGIFVVMGADNPLGVSRGATVCASR